MSVISRIAIGDGALTFDELSQIFEVPEETTEPKREMWVSAGFVGYGIEGSEISLLLDLLNSDKLKLISLK